MNILDDKTKIQIHLIIQNTWFSHQQKRIFFLSEKPKCHEEWKEKEKNFLITFINSQLGHYVKHKYKF